MSSITVSVWSPPVCERPGRDAGGSEEKPEVTPASTFMSQCFLFLPEKLHILLRTYFKYVWCLGKRVELLTGHIRLPCYEHCSFQLNNTKFCQ